MKDKVISILCILSGVLVGIFIIILTNNPNLNIVVDAKTTQEQVTMFERHRLDGKYSILVDKETNVCYLQYGKTFDYQYGITVMLNADGTPKIWREINASRRNCYKRNQ